MNSTIIQVPVSKTLRDKALSAATQQGFSSLQDFLRLVLAKLANKQMVVGFEEPAVKMSKKAETRYAKMAEDFRLRRNVKSFDNLEDLFKDLNS